MPTASLDQNTHDSVESWVAHVAALTLPDRVQWIDGSQAEADVLAALLVSEGKLIRLSASLRPGSFLARTDPADVARVEDRTFICSERQWDAGPTNNWMAPAVMRVELDEAFRGSMRGRTMYVVPFSMGPLGGPISQLGVEITDSPYVVLSMRIMTRAGSAALQLIEAGAAWVPTVHSVGYPLIDAAGAPRTDIPWPCNPLKYIVQFPETREVWSYGSGYGGNALLGKKCFSLRIASVLGRDEGWLAEHMLLIKLTSPEKRSYHLAAAFPSACGKTNLAMLQPTIPGWKVETIGDDIAWMRKGPDGRLRAINPEAGFFGVAPGTGVHTNPIAVATVAKDTIFTNVALTDDGDVWWEGLTADTPDHLIDWEGNDWHAGSDRPAAHPNSRFTVAAAQCPSIAEEWDQLDGVPIDAILFGGRRATNVPLVAQSYSWPHGVLMGATISSEQTAAAEGTVGILRRDPFAMLPFCGYNMADYWGHWLEVGRDLGDGAPEIFQVNWFRKGARGEYLWPGFGDNARVLEWIVGRIDGTHSGKDSPLGVLPAAGELNTSGLNLKEGHLQALFSVSPQLWLDECQITESYFEQFGAALPGQLSEELQQLEERLRSASSDVVAI